jgi:hypothetical protein
MARTPDPLYSLLSYLNKLPLEDQSYHCLRFVDWYGGTAFNQLQMPQVIAELDRLCSNTVSPEDQELLRALCRLAETCNGQVHLYLKFIGD